QAAPCLIFHESAENKSANPHRPVAAVGVLRIPFFLWSRRLWTGRRRRTPLRANRARNARSRRLDHPYAARQTVARKTSPLLLAGDGVVTCRPHHRSGGPLAR